MCIVCTLQCIMHYFEFRVQKYFAFVNKSERKTVVYESKTSKAPRSAELSIDLVWVGLFLFLTPKGPLGAFRHALTQTLQNPFLSHFYLCSKQTFWTYQMSFPHAAGYEKTEDASEKTSLADQEDARLIYLNQPQFTKFCSNRVR